MLSSIATTLSNAIGSSTASSVSPFGTVGDSFEFKRSAALDQRRSVAERIRIKYPDRIPLIIERAASTTTANRNGRATSTPQCEKSKFLVGADSPIANVLAELRRQLRMKPEQALFLFVGKGVIPPTAALVSQIYERFKDEDGFLYIAYACENTFGSALL
jgi:GABA(A) receptor-associated protein